ncbi:MAG: HlyD family efflux transporter periplasmic adaptor subunit [Planctomycetaceae bacterium]
MSDGKFFSTSLTWFCLLLPSVVGAQAQDSSVVIPRITVSLVRQASVSAHDAGVIQQLHVTEGQRVEHGQLLAELTNEQQQLSLKTAELNLAIAVARSEDDLAVQSAATQLREAQAAEQRQQVSLQLSQADSENDVAVRLAESQWKLAGLELIRAGKARQQFRESVSQMEFDRLEATESYRKLQLEQARHDHDQAKLRPQMEQAELQQQKETIARFELALKQTQKDAGVARINREIVENEGAAAGLELRRRRIVAPFDGVVAKIEKQPGEWLEPGTAVIRLIHLQTLQAEGFLDAVDADQSLVGRSVLITPAGRLSAVADQRNGDNGSPPAAGRSEIPGHITFVSSEIDPVNQQVRIRAEFENSDLAIRPGTLGSMRILNSTD